LVMVFWVTNLLQLVFPFTHWRASEFIPLDLSQTALNPYVRFAVWTKDFTSHEENAPACSCWAMW
jgi:hypothetical protein